MVEPHHETPNLPGNASALTRLVLKARRTLSLGSGATGGPTNNSAVGQQRSASAMAPTQSAKQPSAVKRWRRSSVVAPEAHTRPLRLKSLPVELLFSLGRTAGDIAALMDSDAVSIEFEPAKHDSRRQFVFGYGSLLNEHSRRRTVPASSTAFPCLLKGYTRSWNYDCRSTYTAVGLLPDPAGVVNGVLIPLEEADLAHLDQRECDYERVVLNPRSLCLIDDGRSPLPVASAHGATIHTYVSRDPSHKPSSTIPIAQSYVDCIMQGATATLGDEFARMFARLTRDWASLDSDGPAWVDDRPGAIQDVINGEEHHVSGRTSPANNGAMNTFPPARSSSPTRRRYGGSEIDSADTRWIDRILAEELGAGVLAARVPDPGF
ncbi:hypothetical protein DFJ74DRAFT_625244 [Hyaloraphidium curvatum]|nr:hypothetical protein DFJ74DRAFT_625244 [Hyaloraphidium curvatum]